MRYATRIVALHRGRIAADGPALETMNPDRWRRIFEVDAQIAGAEARVYIDYLAALPNGAREKRASP
jgi:ABC-type cobalamin/Fe3+-siderophores transport system ATPase subunit